MNTVITTSQQCTGPYTSHLRALRTVPLSASTNCDKAIDPEQRPPKRRKMRSRQDSNIENYSPPAETTDDYSKLSLSCSLESSLPSTPLRTPICDPAYTLTPPPDLLAAPTYDDNDEEEWEYMFEKEDICRVDPARVFEGNPELNEKMRSILLDWLGQLCHEYFLQTETYLLAVNYIDRYLSAVTGVTRSRLQLVGTTALYIAAKLQEVHPPQLEELVGLTVGACTSNQVLQMEVIMLESIQWYLSAQTSHSWMTACLQQTNSWGSHVTKDPRAFDLPVDLQQVYLDCQTLITACTLSIDSHLHEQSAIAAAAMCLVGCPIVPVYMTRQEGWEAKVRECTNWLKPLHDILLVQNLYPNLAPTTTSRRDLLRHRYILGAIALVKMACPPTVIAC